MTHSAYTKISQANSKPVRKTNRLKDYLSDPKVKAVYQNIRKYKIVISGYDVTKRCNLRCEGCFFFEGDKSDIYNDDLSLQEYRDFFAEEKARGITYPHMAGAEPALVQDRLRVIAEHFQQGLVYTNGTIKIDKDIPFMLHVSVWGNEETDKRYRGAAVFKKALKNYIDDERVVYMYTFNHGNIQHAREVTEKVYNNGGRISFNHYSPSRFYNQRIDLGIKNNARTLQISDASDNLRLTPDDLAQIKDLMHELMVDYPETVLYSPYYNERINDPNNLFTIDPNTGIATNCTILNKPYHRQYHTDFSYDDSECCITNTDCSQCRHYVSAYSILMDQMKAHLKSKELFISWLDVFDNWLAMHFQGYQRTRLMY